MIQLDFHQDFPVGSLGSWFHTVELGFDKQFDPGPVARRIATAAARHNLAHGAPDDARAALTRLAGGDPLPPPKKGDTTMYDTCAHVGWPGGLPYIDDGKPFGEWSIHACCART